MATLDEILELHRRREGPLLPILHDVQAEFGFVSEDSIRAIASALNLSRAEVHGVVSFYHDFTAEKADPARVKLCRAEACQARGVEALIAGLPQEARAKLEPVYCLGLCSVGPNAIVGDSVHARLDITKLTALLEAAT